MQISHKEIGVYLLQFFTTLMAYSITVKTVGCTCGSDKVFKKKKPRGVKPAKVQPLISLQLSPEINGVKEKEISNLNENSGKEMVSRRAILSRGGFRVHGCVHGGYT